MTLKEPDLVHIIGVDILNANMLLTGSSIVWQWREIKLGRMVIRGRLSANVWRRASKVWIVPCDAMLKNKQTREIKREEANQDSTKMITKTVSVNYCLYNKNNHWIFHILTLETYSKHLIINNNATRFFNSGNKCHPHRNVQMQRQWLLVSNI